jgi:hypothetical protein
MKLIFVLMILGSLNACGQQDPDAAKNQNTFNGRALPENVCYVINGGTERPFTGKYWDHHLGLVGRAFMKYSHKEMSKK